MHTSIKLKLNVLDWFVITNLSKKYVDNLYNHQSINNLLSSTTLVLSIHVVQFYRGKPEVLALENGLMKTAELSGPLLDLWVAKSEQMEIRREFGDVASPFRVKFGAVWCRFHPSQVRSEGESVLDHFRVERLQIAAGGKFAEEATEGRWLARQSGHKASGATDLIAAMRLRVLVAFGDQVADDPWSSLSS